MRQPECSLFSECTVLSAYPNSALENGVGVLLVSLHNQKPLFPSQHPWHVMPDLSHLHVGFSFFHECLAPILATDYPRGPDLTFYLT